MGRGDEKISSYFEMDLLSWCVNSTCFHLAVVTCYDEWCSAISFRTVPIQNLFISFSFRNDLLHFFYISCVCCIVQQLSWFCIACDNCLFIWSAKSLWEWCMERIGQCKQHNHQDQAKQRAIHVVCEMSAVQYLFMLILMVLGQIYRRGIK